MDDEWIEKYKKKMLQITKTSLRDGRERQFSVCLNPDTNELETTRTCVGTWCQVTLRRCTGAKLADFHTHPTAPPSPSHLDWANAAELDNKTFCIGVGNYKDVPPKIVNKDGVKRIHMIGWGRGGKPEVFCYRMGSKETVSKWLQRKRNNAKDFAQKYYDNTWFGAESQDKLYTFVKKFGD